MKTPGRRKRDNQRVFNQEWTDKKLHSYHEGATCVGDFFEEATYSLFVAQRLKTDGTIEVCPDLEEPTRKEYFVESKAMGINTGGYFMMSMHQMEDYESWLTDYWPDDQSTEDPDFDPALLYAFWRYRLVPPRKIGSFGFVEDLRDALAPSVLTLCVVDFDTVKAMCRPKREEGEDGTRWPRFKRLYKKDFALLDEDWEAFLGSYEIPIDGHCFFARQIAGLQVYGRMLSTFRFSALVNGLAMGKESISGFFERVTSLPGGSVD